MTVSERARELAAQIFKRDGKGMSSRFQKGVATRRAEAAKLIEQALLAERALALELAVVAVSGCKRKLSGLNRVIAITAIRAAAEKEA